MTFNPYTFEHSAWVRYTTASLLAAAAAGLVYWIASKLFILPRGLGGYTSMTQSSTSAK